MAIKISHDEKSGRWSLSYSRHLISSIGMAFLAGGIVALSGPWWIPIVSFFLGKIDDEIDLSTNYWAATILIVIGLSILAFKFFLLDERARRCAIDRKTITQSPPVVQEVKNYFSNLLDDHSYFSSSDTQFYLACHQFSDTSKAFQDAETAALFKKFSKDARNLHNFVTHNFSVFPSNAGNNSDYRYCLASHLNFDRDMHIYDENKVKKYGELERELSNYVVQSQGSYKEFINRLKQLGHL